MQNNVQIVRPVVIQVKLQTKPISHRSAEHSRSRGGSDQGERLQVEIDHSAPKAAFYGDIDPEIFHGRIKEFFHRFRNAVHLVNKQDVSSLQVGQDGHKVSLFAQCRTGGQPRRSVGHLPGDYMS